MLDIGWQELFIVGILAVIVIGPKDLPKALRTAMQWIRKAKGLARDFQSGVDDMVREAELDDLKKDLNNVAQKDFEQSLKDAVDIDDDLKKEMDLSEVEKAFEKTAKDAKKIGDAPLEEIKTAEPSTPDATETISTTEPAEKISTDTAEKQPASATTASS